MYLESMELGYCCGIKEVELEPIKIIVDHGDYAGDYPCNTPLKLAESLESALGTRAGIICSDNTKKHKVNKWLSKIVSAKYMGVNGNHGSDIYIWIIPKAKLLAFIKSERAKLKPKRKR